MMKNIVFDLGRVLVDFDPIAYLYSLGYDDETVQALYDRIFGGEDWMRHDRGDYPSVIEMQTVLIQKYPEYEAQIRRALQPDWVKIHTLREDTAAYLLELKERGYPVYMLSNLAADSYAYVSRYPFFRALDGGVFSYQERVCKPDARIYEILLQRYALDPAETVFLDDNADNVEAAEKAGIRGIVFTSLDEAKKQLEPLLSDTCN